MRVDLRLYALVDPEHAGGHSLPDLARRVAGGGATLVQLRDKRGATREMVAQARAIKAVLAPLGVPLIVNDRVDVALASGADGVHLGQDDMDVADARRLLGPERSSVSRSRPMPEAQAAPLQHLTMWRSARSFPPRRRTIRAADRSGGIRQLLPRFAPGRRDFRRRDRRHHEANAGDVMPPAPTGSVISALSSAADPPRRAGAARHRRYGAGKARRAMTAIAVTIAGSDSSGGAGIQADLKTFSALGVYGASVITALTAQNTRGVSGIHDVPPAFITAQIDAVFSDLKVGAVKIGMLSQPAAIKAVAAGLKRHEAKNIVLDPVMVAASGDRLLAPEAVEVLRRVLIPRATLITPNLPEAAALLDAPEAQDRAGDEDQAQQLLELGAKAVLMKGGHAEGAESVDFLVQPTERSRGSPPTASRPSTPTAPAALFHRRLPPVSPRALRLPKPSARARPMSPPPSPLQASCISAMVLGRRTIFMLWW